jgi:hypothetical protein
VVSWNKPEADFAGMRKYYDCSIFLLGIGTNTIHVI